MTDVAADGVSSGYFFYVTVTSIQIQGYSAGKGEIHGDGGVSGHRSALGVYFAAWQTFEADVVCSGDINADVKCSG
ncbi:Camp-Dependent Protein Kinase Type Ii-Beta Regulatory Subunit [Manis pentadactyla]|nr:Camp-Dependent Protein Kinase Type Ii-Beta Regulatory Subunit [Manis pentadactyla]